MKEFWNIMFKKKEKRKYKAEAATSTDDHCQKNS